MGSITGSIKFWHLMVVVGLLLVVIGLVLILVPNQVGEGGSILIEVFGAKFEGSEIGLALIVLGIACFLIGQKDRTDTQKYQAMKEDLQKTSKITARLVGDHVEQTLAGVSGDVQRDLDAREMDIGGYRDELHHLQDQEAETWEGSHALRNAERGLELLEALEKEGYSFKTR